jgi:hypothetical protein
MSHLVVGLLTVAILLGAAAALAQSSLGPQARLADSCRDMKERTGDIARTAFVTTTSVSISGGGANTQVRLVNEGQTRLRDYPDWDVILIYDVILTDQLLGHPPRIAQRLTFAGIDTSPGVNQWDITIYRAATGTQAELIEPGIVNFGEGFRIRTQVSPRIDDTGNNTMTIGVANGVSLTIPF